ncbi:hypothetical protein TNCV_221681 [Trichonephila clavipes]|nr:hypothetical protein TNCV_221681 [Trichonephila clavipes]
MVWTSRESPTSAFCQRVVRPKSVIKFVSESVSIRRACAYISRRFTSVFWRGFFFETQSAFLIGLESAEGYPLAVDDSPKRGEIPKTSHIMMYLWVHCLLPGVGNASPFSVGKQTKYRIGLASANVYVKNKNSQTPGSRSAVHVFMRVLSMFIHDVGSSIVAQILLKKSAKLQK